MRPQTVLDEGPRALRLVMRKGSKILIGDLFLFLGLSPATSHEVIG